MEKDTFQDITSEELREEYERRGLGEGDECESEDDGDLPYADDLLATHAALVRGDTLDAKATIERTLWPAHASEVACQNRYNAIMMQQRARTASAGEAQ